MANTLYDKAREGFLRGEFDWDNQTFKVMLVDTAAYTPSFSSHISLNDVSGSAIISPGVALQAKTSVGGAADANDSTFFAVTGPTCEALIVYKDDANPANAKLIAYIDSATGLPITPNGGDIIVVWDNGTNKIFRL